MKARIGWLLVLFVSMAAAGGWFAYSRAHQKPVKKYDTVAVDRGKIVARVTATGTLSALVTVQVGTQVSGRLKEIKVDFNSKVKKGEVLAVIDPQLFDAALDQARANYLAAEGNLVKARAQAVDAHRQLDRNKVLAAEKLIAPADLDTSDANARVMDAQITSAQGALEQARAGMHQAKVNLDYTVIASPIDGVVISRAVDVGQTVAASLAAPVLFTIAEDLTKMQVDTSVAEADVGKLSDGMKSTFTVDAYPGERFEGLVRQIRNAPTTVQNVVTYDAVVDVNNPKLKLKPGMTATVAFIYANRDDTLRIPNAALRFTPPPELLGDAGAPAHSGGHRARGPSFDEADGGAPAGDGPPTERRTVWVLRGLDPSSVSIRTGISDGSLTELVKGQLQEGDSLVTDLTQGGDSAKGAASAAPPMRRLF